MESSAARGIKFQRIRERERAHRAAESAAEKEERLRKRRKRDQERRAAETQEQRQTRLQRKRSRQSESFSSETEEQRGVRLIRLSNNQRERLARESQDKHPLTIGTYANHMNSATLYTTTDSCEILSEHGTSLLKIPLLLYHNTCVGFAEARPIDVETSSLVIIFMHTGNVLYINVHSLDNVTCPSHPYPYSSTCHVVIIFLCYIQFGERSNTATD